MAQHPPKMSEKLPRMDARAVVMAIRTVWMTMCGWVGDDGWKEGFSLVG